MSDKLLDTCVAIDFLRGVRPAVAFVEAILTPPSISILTQVEVFAGLRSQREEMVARGFFRSCRILALDSPIATDAGSFLRNFGRSHGLDIADAIIAATALHHGLSLATLNVKHFPMFPKLKPAY